MKKQVIRLTEGDLRRVIKESVKHILKESFGEARTGENALDVFGKEIGDNLRNKNMQDNIAYMEYSLNRLKTRVEELEKTVKNNDTNTMFTIAQLLPVYFKDLKNYLYKLNQDSYLIDEIERLMNNLNNAITNNNIEQISSITTRLPLYISMLEEDITI